MRLTDKQKRLILFVVYLLFVIKVIVFKYPYEELRTIMDSWSKEVVLEGLDTANFTLFRTIHMYIDYSYMLNSFENLAGNVVVFIPFGMLLPFIWKRFRNFADTFLAGFLFSLGIELFQLYSAFGAFDVDDILLNVAGVIAGYLIYMLLTLGETMFGGRKKKEPERGTKEKMNTRK